VRLPAIANGAAVITSGPGLAAPGLPLLNLLSGGSRRLGLPATTIRLAVHDAAFLWHRCRLRVCVVARAVMSDMEYGHNCCFTPDSVGSIAWCKAHRSAAR
jgi:hypothetical protein